MLAWGYDVWAKEPVVLPSGGLLAPTEEFAVPADADDLGGLDSIATVSLSRSAKPVRFRSDGVLGKSFYPFVWALPGKREVPRQSSSNTPRDPAVVLSPEERYRVAAGAFSFATLSRSSGRGPANGKLVAEVTTTATPRVSYADITGGSTAHVTMASGRIWAQGGAVESPAKHCFSDKAASGEPVHVPVAGSGKHTFVFAFTLGSGSATVNLSPSVDKRGNLVLTPSMCRGRLPAASFPTVDGRRYVAGGAGFFVIAVRGALNPTTRAASIVPSVNASLPHNVPTTISFLGPRRSDRWVSDGGDVQVDVPRSGGVPTGDDNRSPDGCDFGFGVPDPVGVAADFTSKFRGRYGGLRKFSVEDSHYSQLKALSLVGADINGRAVKLSAQSAESIRIRADAPWDRGDNSFFDGIFTKPTDLSSHCFFGPPGDGVHQIDAGQHTDGRVEGIEAILVHRIGSVLVESRIFAMTSTKRALIQPEPAIAVRARALSLDGTTDQVRLRGLTALGEGARVAVGNSESGTVVPIEFEAALPAENGFDNRYALKTKSGTWIATIANWASPSNQFAPVFRHPGPTSELVVVRASGSVPRDPAPTPGEALGAETDLYILSAPSADIPLPSYGTGLFFSFVPPKQK